MNTNYPCSPKDKPSFKDFQKNGTIITIKKLNGKSFNYYKLLHNRKIFFATLDGSHITNKLSYILSFRFRYICSTCKKPFGHQNSLKRHYKEIHEDEERRFKCSQCKKAYFKRKDHLKAHEKAFHNLKDSLESNVESVSDDATITEAECESDTELTTLEKKSKLDQKQPTSLFDEFFLKDQETELEELSSQDVQSFFKKL